MVILKISYPLILPRSFSTDDGNINKGDRHFFKASFCQFAGIDERDEHIRLTDINTSLD